MSKKRLKNRMGRIYELIGLIDTIDNRLENETDLRVKDRIVLKTWRKQHESELNRLRNKNKIF